MTEEFKASIEYDLVRVEEILEYQFRDKHLLLQALTHSSYANDKMGDPSSGNERLEFLGDAVLDAIMAEKLYRMLPNHDEGSLTKLKAAIVCESSLASVSRKYGLRNYIFLGRGELQLGGRDKDSIAADGIESIIGAVYLDGGREAAESMVLRILEDSISDALQGKLFKDYKTALQEVLFGKGIRDIEYKLIGEDGPAHARRFTVQLFINGNAEGCGTGSSKKQAEQNAAKATLTTHSQKER